MAQDENQKNSSVMESDTFAYLVLACAWSAKLEREMDQ
jgi:hypothetical protein